MKAYKITYGIWGERERFATNAKKAIEIINELRYNPDNKATNIKTGKTVNVEDVLNEKDFMNFFYYGFEDEIYVEEIEIEE